MLKVCEDCMYRKTCGNNKTDASKCLFYIPSESMKRYLQGYVDGFACGEQGDIAKYNDACERLEAIEQANKEIKKKIEKWSAEWNTEMSPLPNEYV